MGCPMNIAMIFEGMKILYGIVKSIRSLDKAIRYASNNPDKEPEELPEGCGDDAHWKELLDRSEARKTDE